MNTREGDAMTEDEQTVVSYSDMTCEAHPLRVWPHGDCIGPGMPYQATLGWIRERCARIDWCETHASRKTVGTGRLLGRCEDPDPADLPCQFVVMILVPSTAEGGV